METAQIIKLILNILGYSILWFFLTKNIKDFKLFSFEGLKCFCLTILIGILISIK